MIANNGLRLGCAMVADVAGGCRRHLHATLGGWRAVISYHGPARRPMVSHHGAAGRPVIADHGTGGGAMITNDRSGWRAMIADDRTGGSTVVSDDRDARSAMIADNRAGGRPMITDNRGSRRAVVSYDRAGRAGNRVDHYGRLFRGLFTLPMPVDEHESGAARGRNGLYGHAAVATARIDGPRLVMVMVAVLMPVFLGLRVATVIAAVAIVVSIAVSVARRGIRHQATQAEDHEGGEERALHITPISFC